MKARILQSKSIDRVVFDELDHKLYEKFFGKNYVDDETGLYPEMHGDRVQYGEVIDIDLLINSFMNFKERGATHVSMEYHEDHIGYEIQALKITLAEKSLIEKVSKKKTEDKEKQAKIQELYAEINKIQSSRK